VNAEKSMSQDAAFQERPQFPFHKERHNPAALLLPLQKRFKILPDHAIQNAFFRAARMINKLRFANHAAQAGTVTTLVLVVMAAGRIGGHRPLAAREAAKCLTARKRFELKLFRKNNRFAIAIPARMDVGPWGK
jgi:hypothetical protein